MLPGHRTSDFTPPSTPNPQPTGPPLQGFDGIIFYTVCMFQNFRADQGNISTELLFPSEYSPEKGTDEVFWSYLDLIWDECNFPS